MKKYIHHQLLKQQQPLVIELSNQFTFRMVEKFPYKTYMNTRYANPSVWCVLPECTNKIKWINQDLENKFPDPSVYREAQFFPTENGYVYSCRNCGTLLSLETFLAKYFPERVESYKNLLAPNKDGYEALEDRVRKKLAERESKRQSSSS